MNKIFDASRPLGRLFYCLLSLLCAALAARAQGPVKTTIADTVYRADGTPAGGTLLVTWPQFNTVEAIASKDIADPNRFRDGLSSIIDGVVGCLNASAWAKH